MLKGRASVVKLIVIDSKTGQPLAGASPLWREDADDLFFGHSQNGPSYLPPSSDAGIITINDAHKKMDGRLVLSRPGYTTVYATYSDGSVETSDNIQPPPMPQDLFILDDAQTASMSDNCFIIRMHQ